MSTHRHMSLTYECEGAQGGWPSAWTGWVGKMMAEAIIFTKSNMISFKKEESVLRAT